MPQDAPSKFPPVVRWGALTFLAVWFPVYWKTWGAANFLHLCDVAAILSCVGLWRSSSLLLSSQAVSSLVADMTWLLDAGWRLFLGRHLMGGTEYLFDSRFPLGVRLLTLFHVALPIVLLAGLRRTGYNRRGFALQSAIAATLLIVSRFVDSGRNLNFAFRDAIFHRTWGPAPVHLGLTFVVLVVVIYWPTHAALRSIYAEPGAAPPTNSQTR